LPLALPSTTTVASTCDRIRAPDEPERGAREARAARACRGVGGARLADNVQLLLLFAHKVHALCGQSAARSG